MVLLLVTKRVVVSSRAPSVEVTFNENAKPSTLVSLLLFSSKSNLLSAESNNLV